MKIDEEYVRGQCICQKEKKKGINYMILGYGESVETIIDFENHKIKQCYEREGNSYIKELEESETIDYCPFCGIRLK